ncbi:MAG: glycosyltransferase family 4 protein [Opitutae bacterium]|nr:glycosyltransferase family 4 protein [Opitutae bacterium]
MNILQISTFLQGGAGKVLVDLSRAALEQDHSVSVACTKDSVDGYGNYPEHLNALEHMDIPVIFLDSTFSRDPQKNLQASTTLHSSMTKRCPDLIHSHSSIPSMVSMDALSRLNKKIPIIQTMHGWGIFKTNEQEQQDIEILNRVNHIVSISKASENLLLGKGLSNPNRSFIYNGLERTVPEEETQYDEHLAKIKSLKKDGHKIIGIIGTVDARKNQSLVLEALSVLPKSLRFQAIFVGEGQNLSAYREKAKSLDICSKVTFTGYKPSARSYVKECDLLISASLSEGAAPLAILEAFSEKTPVLASDTPENREAIEDGHNGFLFRSGNTRNLSEKISSSLSSPKSDQIIASAHDLFLSHYSLDSTMENYLSLYSRLRESN